MTYPVTLPVLQDAKMALYCFICALCVASTVCCIVTIVAMVVVPPHQHDMETAMAACADIADDKPLILHAFLLPPSSALMHAQVVLLDRVRRQARIRDDKRELLVGVAGAGFDVNPTGPTCVGQAIAVHRGGDRSVLVRHPGAVEIAVASSWVRCFPLRQRFAAVPTAHPRSGAVCTGGDLPAAFASCGHLDVRDLAIAGHNPFAENPLLRYITQLAGDGAEWPVVRWRWPWGGGVAFGIVLWRPVRCRRGERWCDWRWERCATPCVVDLRCNV